METFLKEYEILLELGGGAFAEVFKVRHIELEYVRAIRVMKCTISGKESRQYKSFLEECKFLLRLGNGGHPNIVRIYKPELIANKALWEMDYIEGSTVDEFIKENKHFVPLDEIYRFLLDITGALSYCHVDNYWFSLSREEDKDLIEADPDDGRKIIISEENKRKLIKKYCVVHNDIKSNNIIRKKHDGSYILLDFGLAFDRSKQITRSSLMKHGAVEYKAPEKWDEKAELMTERTDIYSFGVTLYEMLAGRVPFPVDPNMRQEEADYRVSENHKNEPPPAIEPLRRAAFADANNGKTWVKDYPDWLERVIMKCLEKRPENRYADGSELYEEVKKYFAGQEQSATVAKISEIQKEKDDLFNNFSKFVYEAQHEKQQVEAKIKALDDRNAELENKVKELTNRKTELEKQNTELKTKFKNQNTGSDQINELDSQNEKLRNQNKALNDQINELGGWNTNLNNLNRELDDQNAKLENRNVELENKVKELTNRKTHPPSSSGKLFWVALSIILFLTAGVLEIMYLRERATGGTDEYERIVSENANLQQQHTEDQTEITWLDSQVATLKEQIDTLKKSLDAGGDASDLQKIIQEKETEIARLRVEVQSLKLQKSSGNNSDLQNQITRLDGRISSFEQEIKQKDQEIKQRQQEYNKLREQMKSIARDF